MVPAVLAHPVFQEAMEHNQLVELLELLIVVVVVVAADQADQDLLVALVVQVL